MARGKLCTKKLESDISKIVEPKMLDIYTSFPIKTQLRKSFATSICTCFLIDLWKNQSKKEGMTKTQQFLWSWKLTARSLPSMYDGWMVTVKRGFSDLKALALTRFSATPPSFLGHWSNSSLTNELLVHPTRFPPTPWADPEMTWNY